MRKTVKTENTVKSLKNKSVKSRFTLSPSNAEEREYLRNLKELLKKKRHGDWVLIASGISIPVRSVESAYFRVYGKNHFLVVDKLKELINNRKELIKTKEPND